MLFQTSAIKRPQLQDSQKCLLFSNLFTGRKVEGSVKEKELQLCKTKSTAKGWTLFYFGPRQILWHVTSTKRKMDISDLIFHNWRLKISPPQNTWHILYTHWNPGDSKENSFLWIVTGYTRYPVTYFNSSFHARMI